MASISCQHIYKIYPGATAPSVTDFNLEIQDKEFIIFVGDIPFGQISVQRKGGSIKTRKSLFSKDFFD